MCRFFALIIAAVLFSAAAVGQTKVAIENMKPDTRQSVLNGRAYLMFPKAAVNMARATDVMAAPANDNEETRIMLDQDKMRLVFFARELYTVGDRALFLHALNDNSPAYKFNKKILTDKDSVISILSSPTLFDSVKKVILVSSLLIKAADNSIFRIDAFINPEAYNSRLAYQKLAEKIFGTLTKGNRRMQLTAHRESFFAIKGSARNWVLDLPAGYTVTKDAGPDFQVLKFHKYQPVTDTDWVALTLYTGNNPSFFYHDYQFEENTATKVSGSFLGKPVTWLSFKSAEKKIFLKEQQIPADDIESGLIVHIAMMSNKEKSLEELTQIIAAIKLQ